MSEPITLTVALYGEDAETVSVRRIAAGLQPFILIESGADNPEELGLRITSSLVAEDREELADHLDEITALLRHSLTVPHLTETDPLGQDD